MSKTKARARAKARAAANLADPEAAKARKTAAKAKAVQFDKKADAMRNTGGAAFNKTTPAVRRGAARSR